MNLRGFLMRHPRPATIRVQLLDGTDRTVTVDPKIPWVQLAAYVADLEPESIECLDPEGTVLRGTHYEHLDDSSDDDDGLLPAPMAATTARVQLPEDPEGKRLVLFAQLLADAYRHTTDVAFDKMIGLFEQVNKRYEHTEKVVDRLYRTVERLTEQRIAAAQKEEDEFGLSELVGAFQGGQAQHLESQTSHHPRSPAPAPRREPPPPGSYPNGKAPHA
jgi:hypothetical protein